MSENLAHLLDRTKDTFEVVRIGNKDGDVLILQSLREYFEL